MGQSLKENIKRDNLNLLNDNVEFRTVVDAPIMSLLKPVYNADFFSKQYFDSAVKECPKLANLSGEAINDYMLTVLAYNLSYNAFYRGKRYTAIKLLQSVLNSSNLSDRVYRSAALLEIQICLELNQFKLAQYLLLQSNKFQLWQNVVDEQQKENYELLSARCKARLSSSILETNSLHWFLFDCEQQLKSGDSRNSLNALFSRRKNAKGNERRILDNAIGCVFAYYFKDCNMAESYFRNAMISALPNEGEFIPILSSTLIYHTALAQLGSGKPKLAGLLFLSVWPFYSDNPRIWLRISECCVNSKNNIFSLEHEQEVLKKAALRGWNAVKNNVSGKCIQLPSAINCGTEFGVYVIHQGLAIALEHKDYAYLLPYLYSLYAFANLRLKQYEIALKAATDLLNLPQINPRQKLMGMFYKTENLIYLNRLQEAIVCLQQATPLQSITYTFSRIIYNQALLEALNGKYERSLEILNELNASGNSYVPRPEANLLRMYLDMRLRRLKVAKQVFKSLLTVNHII